MMVGPDTEVI